MRRINRWNSAMRNATPAQFRRLLKSRKPELENAIAAGRSLAKLLLDGRVMLTGVDDIQLNRYLRRFRVHANFKAVMYAVATRNLNGYMLNQRLDRHFPYLILPSGKRRYVKRCALCGKRTCRCFPVQDAKRKKAKKAVVVPKLLVSVRGIPVEQI